MFIHHLYSINNLLVKTRSQELPTSADQDYVEVLVQAVDTPDLFYVQLKEDKQRLVMFSLLQIMDGERL